MFELMLEYFESLTKSLYQENLNPLACQIGACILIHEAEQKISPLGDFYDDGEPVPLGVELQFFCDFIHDFFFDYRFNRIPGRKIDYIDVYPYEKFKKRVFEAFAELGEQQLIESIKHVPNGNIQYIITVSLKRYQVIPYSIFCQGAV